MSITEPFRFVFNELINPPVISSVSHPAWKNGAEKDAAPLGLNLHF
jgi:hypothetical protein